MTNRIPWLILLWTVTAFSAPTSQPISIKTTKDLNHLSNTLANKSIRVYPGTYDVTPKLIEWQHVLLYAADANNPPSFRVSDKDAGRWLFNSDRKTSDVTIRDINLDLPSNKGGFLHVIGGDQVRLIHCYQNKGNVIWCEGQAGHFYIQDHTPGEPGDKYQACSFVALVQEIIIDERGVPNAWWYQGAHESDIRWMDVKHTVCLGIHGVPSHYKFWGQDRADGTSDASGLHEWIQCTVSDEKKPTPNQCATIGWMALSAGIPSHPLGTSRWTDCTIDGWTQENKTCKRIEFINTRINGKVTNKTVTN